MREIKFRAWDKMHKEMLEKFNIFGVPNFLDDPFESGENRFEILQYTGLLDKNGKEIYESDVLKFSDSLTNTKNNIGQVGFMNGSFVIKGESINHYRWVDYELEVVGNIHKNPDLLGGEKDGDLS